MRLVWLSVLLVLRGVHSSWLWWSSAGCGCENVVPLEHVVETLERALASQVAGHERVRSRLLAFVRRLVWARSAGRRSGLRLHLTGPSGVGKSFLSKLLATSFFEESAAYTGYRAAGLAATTTATSMVLASTAASSSAALASTGASALTTALAAAPLAASGAALAAVAGWRLVEYGESFWGVEPRHFPTQCGVGWWKFSSGGDEESAIREVDRAIAHAAKVLQSCSAAVLIFEDVNRLPVAALATLGRLTQPILRSRKRAVSLRDAILVFTSDLYAPNSTSFVLEEHMTYEEAQEIVEAQSRQMWVDSPVWFTRDLVTLPLPPLDDDDLRAAVNLYLRNELPKAIRDALRFEFNSNTNNAYSFASKLTAYRQEWTGSVAFDEHVLDHVTQFVRRGPSDWRCHAITHFHTTYVEPRIEFAVKKLLRESHSAMSNHGVFRVRVYTSGLLLHLEPRTINAGTPFERLVFNSLWDVIHHPQADHHDHHRQPPPAPRVRH